MQCPEGESLKMDSRRVVVGVGQGERGVTADGDGVSSGDGNVLE